MPKKLELLTHWNDGFFPRAHHELAPPSGKMERAHFLFAPKRGKEGELSPSPPLHRLWYSFCSFQKIMNSENVLAPLPFHPGLPLWIRRSKGEPLKRKVLITDDDLEIAELLKVELEATHEFEVTTAAHPYEAIRFLLEDVYDFLVLDWNLPHLDGTLMNGLKTILEAERIFTNDPDLPLDWESRKVGVITFSGQSGAECRLPSTRHFRYLGHLDKKGAFEGILKHVRQFLNGI